MVSNESIRRWVLKFGPIIAKNLRAIRPKAHSRWHLDEMMISIAGRQMYMWRAVDSEGEVLEIKAAALRLLRKLPRRQGFVPTVIVTDKLRSYGAAFREIGFSGLHEQGLRANNRAENSHQPLRRRERISGFGGTSTEWRFMKSLASPAASRHSDDALAMAACLSICRLRSHSTRSAAWNSLPERRELDNRLQRLRETGVAGESSKWFFRRGGA